MEERPQQKEILARLRRIEGQVRGLQRMVEEQAPCADILVQVTAVTAAMKKAGLAMMQAYMEECLGKAAEAEGKARGDSLKDFQRALSRYIDFA